MQGVLDRFLPTLFIVITIATGHKTQLGVHDVLLVIFISSVTRLGDRITLLK